MPDHVHLVTVPKNKNSFRQAFGEVHRRYTQRINKRKNWKGYLWQGRFKSYVMDNDYLLTAVRYIEMNPVRAGLVTFPENWRWSSASTHMKGRKDRLCSDAPIREMIPISWRKFLKQPVLDEEIEHLRKMNDPADLRAV